MIYRKEFFKYTKKKGRVNRKTTIYNGHKYDSLLEAKYAENLDWRLRAKEIKGWEPHPNLHITFHNPKTGEQTKLFSYEIDFKIIHLDDSLEYVEVKSSWTGSFQDFRFKWKIVSALWEFTEYADSELTLVVN